VRQRMRTRASSALPDHETAIPCRIRRRCRSRSVITATDPASPPPCPHQIAQGLVCFVGNPDRRQITVPMIVRQLQRIYSVGLHPITSLDWNQGRGHHIALHTERRQLPTTSSHLACRYHWNSAFGTHEKWDAARTVRLRFQPPHRMSSRLECSSCCCTSQASVPEVVCPGVVEIQRPDKRCARSNPSAQELNPIRREATLGPSQTLKGGSHRFGVRLSTH